MQVMSGEEHQVFAICEAREQEVNPTNNTEKHFQVLVLYLLLKLELNSFSRIFVVS
jgi:hypothetical protein